MHEQAAACATPADPQTKQRHDPASGATAPPPKGQRDAQGRFAAGNRGGPGNPFARQTAGLRKALVNAVSEKDIADSAAVLLDKARQGDVAACKLVFSYTLGKPAAATDPDTLDQQEMHTLANNHVGMDEVQRVATLLPVGLVLAFLHSILPYLEKAKAMQWHDLWQQMGAKKDQEQAEDKADDSAEAEAADAAAAVAPPQGERQTLEQAVRAWQAQTKELKAKLSGVKDRAGEECGLQAPCEKEATDPVHDLSLANATHPRAEREDYTGEGRPCRPSRNGSNRAPAGSANDDRADKKRW